MNTPGVMILETLTNSIISYWAYYVIYRMIRDYRVRKSFSKQLDRTDMIA